MKRPNATGPKFHRNYKSFTSCYKDAIIRLIPQKRPATTADCLDPTTLTPLIIATVQNYDPIQLAESISPLLYITGRRLMTSTAEKAVTTGTTIGKIPVQVRNEDQLRMKSDLTSVDHLSKRARDTTSPTSHIADGGPDFLGY